MKGIFRAIKWMIVGFVGALLFMVRRESLKETLMNLMSHIFFGEGTCDHYTKRYGYYTRQNYTDYVKYAKYANVKYANFVEREKKHRGDIKNHTYDNREQAEKVLGKMDDFIFSFGFASIGDLEDCIKDVTNIVMTRGHNDRDYGWENLDKASVKKVPDGWVIKWPFEKHTEDVRDEKVD